MQTNNSTIISSSGIIFKLSSEHSPNTGKDNAK